MTPQRAFDVELWSQALLLAFRTYQRMGHYGDGKVKKAALPGGKSGRPGL